MFFLSKITELWFKEWPECDELFPVTKGTISEPLTQEQLERLSTAIDARKLVSNQHVFDRLA